MPALSLLISTFLSVILLKQSLVICKENERLATLSLGRITPLKGPGLIFIIPFIQQKAKVSIGDIAELVNSEIAKIGNIPFHCISPEQINLGSLVQITGFEENKGEIRAIGTFHLPQKTTVTCEKCGHRVTI